jgi:hypothetical protein
LQPEDLNPSELPVELNPSESAGGGFDLAEAQKRGFKIPIPEKLSTLGELNAMALGAGAGILEEAGPNILKATGALMEMMPAYSGPVPPTPQMQELQAKRSTRTPAEFAKDVIDSPFTQAGIRTKKYFEEAIPRSEAEKESLLGQGSEMATAMTGYALAGAAGGGLAAASLIGMESFANHIINDFEELKGKMSEEEAGKLAMKKAAASGVLQTAIFAYLPKPLRKYGEKFIVDKFGEKALANFVGKRIGSAAQTTALFDSAAIAENIVSGRDPRTGIDASSISGILFGLVSPYGKTKSEIKQRIELSRKYSEPSPEELVQSKYI